MNNTTSTTFHGDMLDRREFAEGIYRLISKLDQGVIGVNGDWGVGKTWFGENLRKLIDNNAECGTVWIDAFEADWSDDPALTLIAEISAQMSVEDREKFIGKVAPFILKAIPAVAKAGIRTVGNYIGADKDVIDGVTEIFDDSADSYVREKIEELAAKKKALTNLKSVIEKYVHEQSNKKVVIFVDELDRCSPAYAIKLLERLKHLFDIKGVFFILLWNRDQIKNAIQSFYGSGTNGQMFLDKFVDYPLNLSISNVRRSSPPMERLLMSFTSTLPQEDQLQFQQNIDWLKTVSMIIGLNARETKRVSTWWVMSKTRNFVALENWVLAIKVKYPDMYDGIRMGDTKVHEFLRDLLLKVPDENSVYKIAQLLIKYHECHITGNFVTEDSDVIHFFTNPAVSIRESLGVAIRHIENTFE